MHHKWLRVKENQVTMHHKCVRFKENIATKHHKCARFWAPRAPDPHSTTGDPNQGERSTIGHILGSAGKSIVTVVQ